MTDPAFRSKIVRSGLEQLIEKYGWAVQHVEGGEWPSEPPMSYTVGLTMLGHAELVLLGLPAESSMPYLSAVVEQVRNGVSFKAGQLTRIPRRTGTPVAFIQVEDDTQLTAIPMLYDHFSCLQLVWCDSRGRFPWDQAWANAIEDQPFLGTVPLAWTP